MHARLQSRQNSNHSRHEPQCQKVCSILINNHLQKEYGFQEGDFIQVFRNWGSIFSETRTGGTRTTSPFCNLYSGLIRPLFTRTSPLRRMR